MLPSIVTARGKLWTVRNGSKSMHRSRLCHFVIDVPDLDRGVSFWSAALRPDMLTILSPRRVCHSYCRFPVFGCGVLHAKRRRLPWLREEVAVYLTPDTAWINVWGAASMGTIGHGQGPRRNGSPPSGLPAWGRPAPLGYGPAFEAVGNVAAPLLAGFSVSTIGIVLTAESAIRWPGAVFIALTLAAASFIMCVQCNFHGRLYFYSPAEAADWWSESDFKERHEDIQAEQEYDLRIWHTWMNRARRLYNLGLFALWAGMAFALMPPPRESQAVAGARWAAVGIAGLVIVIELLWGIIPSARRYRRRRKILKSAQSLIMSQ
jgi:hypothetical protein